MIINKVINSIRGCIIILYLSLNQLTFYNKFFNIQLSENMSMNCGNPESIAADCQNFVANYDDGTWEWGQDRTFKLTVSKSVNIAGIGIEVLVGVMGA